MNNREFRDLSEKEVKKYNGSDNEEAFQAWRVGCNYARSIVYKHLQSDHMDEFITNMEGFSEKDLDEIFYDYDEINCSLCGNNFIGLPDEDILKQ